MKIANSTAKTAELKTMAVTKVAVEADFAVAALTSDLQTSQSLRKQEGRIRTWRMAGKKDYECGVGIYRRQSILIMPDGADVRAEQWLTRSLEPYLRSYGLSSCDTVVRSSCSSVRNFCSRLYWPR